MAISKLEVGVVPLGVGGDSLRSAAAKINENFSNETHAASKLVGTGSGQIPMAQDSYKAAFSQPMRTGTATDVNEMLPGEMWLYGTNSLNTPRSENAWIVRSILDYTGSFTGQFQIAHQYEGGEVYTRQKQKTKWSEWAKHYTSVNTTKDSKTNLLLASGSELPENSAASRLVGTGTNQIPLAQDALKAALGSSPITYQSTSPEADLNLDNLAGGDIRSVWRNATVGTPPQLTNNFISVLTMRIGAISGNSRFQFAWGQNVPGFVWRTSNHTGVWQAWEKPYTDINTTKDSNGFIKAASPIVKVFADKVELNGEAEDQDVSYKKNGVGDYTITTVSGLSTDGWYIELPKDMNGNPKVAVTLSEVDGVISLKSYKRIFSMETFTFEPDLDNPLDIPDTRWIDLRLNEIPVEVPEEELYEPEPEEEPVEDEVVEPEVVEEVVEPNE